MTHQPSQYQSYLLRLWRSNDHSPWRSSLQCTASGDKQTFTDLPALVNFLLTQLAAEAQLDVVAAPPAPLQAQQGPPLDLATLSIPFRLDDKPV